MRTSPRTALVLTLSAAACAATLTAPAQAAPAPPAPALSWKPCTEGSGNSPGLECATLSVPMDYREPEGRKLDLAVSRLRSDRPSARRGTLLVIAGGPGTSGVDRLAAKGPTLRQRTGGSYDLVSIDPRGVGRSTKADCGLTADDREMTHLRSWPAPDGDIGGNVTRARRVAAACERNGGDLLRSFTTANEARDIDLFRQALGEEKLSAWGMSYGTYVGAVYAQKFPQRTDRWVLDSSADPDPSHVAHGWLTGMAAAAEDRFPDFAAYAADPARDAAHRVAERPEDVRPAFLALARQLDGAPREFARTEQEKRDGTPHFPLTGNRLRQGLQQALYSDGSFERLAALVVAARDTTGPLTVPDVLPGTPLTQDQAAVSIGVICNDVNWPRSVAAYARATAADRARHPLTAGMPANITPCAFWKGGATEKPTRVTDRGPSNILMVQNLRDPATPHRGGLKMRAALGDRARLVTVDSGGHGAYLAHGNACGDGLVTNFLTTGSRPERDVTCPAETG
ncbi:alpha/beta hydrolase [Streptomyces sp. NPDC046215]